MSFATTPFTSWDDLTRQACALVEGEPNLVANLANLSALIMTSVPNLNWAGFYLWDAAAGELVLGPFQGKPACLRIRPERGVCGRAWSTRQTQNVPDVHAFPGHIACDAASRAELVVPLLVSSTCVAVLDLDSPHPANFTELDARGATDFVSALVPWLWPNGAATHSGV
jgi:L-methionine (R)-S-oxide reductase